MKTDQIVNLINTGFVPADHGAEAEAVLQAINVRCANERLKQRSRCADVVLRQFDEATRETIAQAVMDQS